jgi:uncharacterized protein YdhG (YjbR/CyaY superfamily)
MSTKKKSGFTDAERAAIKERAQELKTQGRGGQKRADNEQTVLDAIAEMPDDDRVLGERIHALVTEKAPDLLPKTWYGMPAYANSDGKVICFFQSADKFDSRYASLGFNDDAKLDDGSMWPVSFAILEWNPEVERQVRNLVEVAVS